MVNHFRDYLLIYNQHCCLILPVNMLHSFYFLCLAHTFTRSLSSPRQSQTGNYAYLFYGYLHTKLGKHFLPIIYKSATLALQLNAKTYRIWQNLINSLFYGLCYHVVFNLWITLYICMYICYEMEQTFNIVFIGDLSDLFQVTSWTSETEKGT